DVLIVDEASQIQLADYIPVFHRFHKSLKRVCFVGDHKQLAPYGQSDFPDLQSVFEVDHLVGHATFLDTQYRMPLPVGHFISKHVYDDKLKSVHKINASNCVQFVDVDDGVEEKVSGGSSKNTREVQVAILCARQMQKSRKSYRILTGYDAQRQAIEDALKKAGLKWEDIVFNVDSFQGNEADFVIVSVVRTKSPGFL
ncbi:hypothetical protein BS47DRAFT_1249813, partial [Hydnum rufescens UP504]